MRTSSPFFALTCVNNPSVVVATMRAGVCASPGQKEMPRGEYRPDGEIVLRSNFQSSAPVSAFNATSLPA